MEMNLKFCSGFIGALVLLTCSGCSFNNQETKPTFALVRGVETKLITANDVPLDQHATAVLVLPGRNAIKFRYFGKSGSGRSPRDLNVMFDAIAGMEYVISRDPTGQSLCVWPLKADSSIDFSRNAGCVTEGF